MELNYVTSSEYKIFMTRQFMAPFNITVNQIKLDNLAEIQDCDVKNVAQYSAELAYRELGVPLMKNDGGLYIPALNGFPGAFTKYAEDMLGEDGILTLMKDIPNREAYWLEALAYVDKDTIKIFTCKTEGYISLEKSGQFGWGYDKIFIPKGQTKTLANFEDSPRGMLWDNSGYKQLAQYILSKNGIDKNAKNN